MKTHATFPGKAYTVTSAVDCTVSTPEGVVITTHAPGAQTLFIAPTAEVQVSDDAAFITEAFKGASLAVAGGGGAKVPAEDAGVFDVLEYDSLRGLSVVHANSSGTVDGRLRLMVTQYGENLVGSNPMTLQAPSITYSTAHEASSYTDSATGTSYVFAGHTLSTTEMGAYGIEEACTWMGDPKLPLRLRGTEVTVNGESMIPEVTFDATSTAPISGAGVQDGLDKRLGEETGVDENGALRTKKRIDLDASDAANGDEILRIIKGATSGDFTVKKSGNQVVVQVSGGNNTIFTITGINIHNCIVRGALSGVDATFSGTLTYLGSNVVTEAALDERFGDLGTNEAGKLFTNLTLGSNSRLESADQLKVWGTSFLNIITCSGSATFNSYVNFYGEVSLSSSLTTSGNLRLYEDSMLEVWPSSGLTRTILATYPPDASDAVDSLQVSPEGELMTRGKKVATEDMCVSYGNPAGTIIMHAADAVAGYLLCNGAAVSRTEYAELFAAIGEKFGAGDGSSTFNLPDFRNRAPWGADGNAGTKLAAGLPNITGGFCDPTTYSADSWGWGSLPHYSNGQTFAHTGHTSNARTYNAFELNAAYSNSIYGNSNTVQPPALAINFFIKY